MAPEIHQPLDSRQLRAFALLAYTGSYTLAARQLFLSQSAVSHSMKALERDVGCRLLDKVGKKIILTQAGEQLLVHAERIIGEMVEARSSLEKLNQWGRSRLRIGASATACQYILPPVLNEFKKSYPTCLISIEPSDTDLAVARMENNQVDLAITMKPRIEEDKVFVPLFHDHLVFLVGPDHDWARNGQVLRAEIPRQQYVLYNNTSYTHQLITEYFNQDNVVLNTVMRLGSMEAIKELVKLGLGVSILAPWIARDEIQSGELVSLPLGRRKLQREWGLVYRKGKTLSMVEETFLNICRRHPPSPVGLRRDPSAPGPPDRPTAKTPDPDRPTARTPDARSPTPAVSGRNGSAH